jgi:hypothetical protein
MKSSVSWGITPCRPLRVNRRFGGTCRLHIQGRRISQETRVKAGGEQSNRLADISGCIGKRKEKEDRKSVPIGSPVAQNEPPVPIGSPVAQNEPPVPIGSHYWASVSRVLECKMMSEGQSFMDMSVYLSSTRIVKIFSVHHYDNLLILSALAINIGYYHTSLRVRRDDVLSSKVRQLGPQPWQCITRLYE